MSLAERLVLLHVGSTAVLLAVLGLVTAVRHVVERLGRRGEPTAPVPAAATQVVRSLETRAVDRRPSGEPRVAGATRRSS